MLALHERIAPRIRLIGLAAVIVSLGAWAMEWSGIVAPCPYCEVERTAIGILGGLLLLPVRGSWAVRYLATVTAAFGGVTAATQHFNGWMAIHKGDFAGLLPIYSNSFLLSAAALFIIVAEWMILADLHTVRVSVAIPGCSGTRPPGTPEGA